jgi:hypothetical protein
MFCDEIKLGRRMAPKEEAPQMSYHVKRVREPDHDAEPEPDAARPKRGPLLAGVPDPGKGPTRGRCRWGYAIEKRHRLLPGWAPVDDRRGRNVDEFGNHFDRFEKGPVAGLRPVQDRRRPVRRGFTARHREDGIPSNAVNPGGIRTALPRYLTRAQFDDMGWTDAEGTVVGTLAGWKTVAQGAATTMWAAVAPDLDGVGGQYLDDCAIATGQISALRERGESISDLVAGYGVSRATIYRALNAPINPAPA